MSGQIPSREDGSVEKVRLHAGDRDENQKSYTISQREFCLR